MPLLWMHSPFLSKSDVPNFIMSDLRTRLSMTGFICAYPHRLTNIVNNVMILFFIKLLLLSLEIIFVVDGKFVIIEKPVATLHNLLFHLLVVKMLEVNLPLWC